MAFSLRKTTKNKRKTNQLNGVETFEPRALLHAVGLYEGSAESHLPQSNRDDFVAAEVGVGPDSQSSVEKSDPQARQKSSSTNLVTVRGEERQEGKPIAFTFEIINRDQQTMKITYKIVDGDKASGNADRNSDYTYASAEQTISVKPGGIGGIQTHQLTVNTVDDRKVEPDEEFKLEIINVENGAVNGTGFNADYTYSKILNDDSGIAISEYVVGYEDGSERMAFTVRATEPEALKFNNPISAQAVFGQGSATRDVDFTAATLPSSVRLNYQTPSVEHVVKVHSDNVVEGSEDFRIVLTNLTGSIDPDKSTLIGHGLIKDGSAPAKKVTKVAIIGNGSQSDFAVAVANLNGELERDFGTNGIATTDLGGDDSARVAVVQDNGKIVVAGATDTANVDADVALVRYNVDGTLDTEFGTEGVAIIDVGGRDLVESIVLSSDGGVIVAVTSSDPFDGYLTPVMLKFDADGRLDAGFGNGGLAYVEFDGSAIARDLEIASDGGVFLTGSWFDVNESLMYVSKYQPDGSLDATFGENGVSTVRIGDVNLPTELALYKDSVLLSATIGIEGTFDTALVSMSLTGELDAGFGDGGIVLAGAGGNEFTRDIAIDHDGRILVAGVTNVQDPLLDSFTMRFLNDGSRDLAFGDHGIRIDNAAGSGDVYELTIDNDGRPISLGGNYDQSADLLLSYWDSFGQIESVTEIAEALADYDFSLNSAVFILGIDGEQLTSQVEEFEAEITSALAGLMDSDLFRPVGDSNGDGRFDSSDLIRVFVAGLYESNEAASFEEGDWNGDGVFDSADLIEVFKAGNFEQAPQISASEGETIADVVRLSELAQEYLDVEEWQLAQETQSSAEVAFTHLSQTLFVPGAYLDIALTTRTTTITDPAGNPITSEEAKRTGNYDVTSPVLVNRVFPGPDGTSIDVTGGTRKEKHRRQADGKDKRIEVEVRDANGKLITKTTCRFDAAGNRVKKTETTDPATGKKLIVEETLDPTGKKKIKRVEEWKNKPVPPATDGKTYKKVETEFAPDGKTKTKVVRTELNTAGSKTKEKTTTFNGKGQKTMEVQRNYDPTTGTEVSGRTIVFDPDTGEILGIQPH